MSTNLVIFEDNKYSNLYPLVYFRPVYELRCGTMTLGQRISNAYSVSEVYYFMRDYLKDLFSLEHGTDKINEHQSGKTLFVNGRILACEYLTEIIPLEGENEVFYSNDVLVALRCNDIAITPEIFLENKTSNVVSDFKRTDINIELINYCWDLVNKNEEMIIKDFEKLTNKFDDSIIYPGVYMLNPENISLGNNLNIKPTVVLDAENGPIIIEDNVTINSHTTIQGPAFIGHNTIVKSHTIIYDGSSIGEWCKVGGEIENTIIHSYSNKQHEGFLGHAYIAKWVNIGASTNNSDLKNNYSNVSVYVNNTQVNTGSQFVGLFLGDHCKTGINTMFNTGTVAGPASNIYGAGFPSKNIPAFTFGGVESSEVNILEKAIETAKKSMQRRNVEFSDEHYKVFEYVYALTEKDRQ